MISLMISDHPSIDPAETGVTVEARDFVFLQVTGTAMQLQTLIDHPALHLGRIELGFRGEIRRKLAVEMLKDALVHQRPGRIEFRQARQYHPAIDPADHLWHRPRKSIIDLLGGISSSFFLHTESAAPAYNLFVLLMIVALVVITFVPEISLMLLGR
jgi:hypothetical protein